MVIQHKNTVQYNKPAKQFQPMSNANQHFERALAHLLKVEGGYVNDPLDSGSATRYGITEEVARKHGYLGRMDRLPLDIAKAIYRTSYWEPLSLDTVAQMSEPLASRLFDLAVNAGVGRAGEFLQRLLNVLNDGGRHYPDLRVDGAPGPVTMAALRAYHKRRGAEGMDVLRRGVNCLQGAFYVELAEKRPKDERFAYGWLSLRVT